MLRLVVPGFLGSGRRHRGDPFVEALPGFFGYLTSERGQRLPYPERAHAATTSRGFSDLRSRKPYVASDILGKSGRAMLDALVAGTTDPGVLADLALGKLRQDSRAARSAAGTL
jgi:hypothetical protein